MSVKTRTPCEMPLRTHWHWQRSRVRQSETKSGRLDVFVDRPGRKVINADYTASTKVGALSI